MPDALPEDSDAFAGSVQVLIESLAADDLRVVWLRGTEPINTLYSFDVFFAGSAAHRGELASSTGRRALLSLNTQSGKRGICGTIATVRIMQLHRERIGYLITVVPLLWTLSKTKNRRVFQQSTSNGYALPLAAR